VLGGNCASLAETLWVQAGRGSENKVPGFVASVFVDDAGTPVYKNLPPCHVPLFCPLLLIGQRLHCDSAVK